MEKSEFILKVSIHCGGCKRDIGKQLKKMKGVDSFDIDAERDEVKITGTVNPDVVISMLAKKFRKQAELLSETTTSPPESPERAVPKKLEADSQIVERSPSNDAVDSLNMAEMAEHIGEMHRMIPGLKSVDYFTTMRFNF